MGYFYGWLMMIHVGKTIAMFTSHPNGFMVSLYHLPSGKQLHNYGKSPFWMGKSTISMAIFNSYIKLQGGMAIDKVLFVCFCAIFRWVNPHLDITKGYKDMVTGALFLYGIPGPWSWCRHNSPAPRSGSPWSTCSCAPWREWHWLMVGFLMVYNG